jgi:hypothetical protein
VVEVVVEPELADAVVEPPAGTVSPGALLVSTAAVELPPPPPQADRPTARAIPAINATIAAVPAL